MMYVNLVDLRKVPILSAAIPAVFALLAPMFVWSQAAQSATPAAIAVPAVMTEMECMGSQCVPDAKVSGSWKFDGILGTADWNNGAEARIVVERFDESGVDIRRIDLATSSSYGQTAVYTGTLHGNRIQGDVVWSWSGHWNDEHLTGHWTAVIENSAPLHPADAIKIPAALDECEADQCAPGRTGGCLWTLNDHQGEARCRDGAHFKLEVQKFDTDGIVLRRTELSDSVSAGLTALYIGKLHGDRIIGIGTWSWPGHWNNHNPAGRWFATVAEGDHHDLPPVPGPLVSPEVHADGSVTFRAFAPASLEVFVQLEGEKAVIMQKDGLGVWSLTTKPLAPDYYGYIFQDTGVPLIDPLNPLILPNILQTENMVHVPGPSSLPWEIGDGPHGTVSHHFFHSKVIGDDRDFYVYTPPGYEADNSAKYPVLYLLHGFGQVTRSWLDVGFANRILDHLIDEGKARPMIVVMPDAYGGEEILARGAYWTDAIRTKNFDRFAESLFEEVMPQVEKDYKVEPGRDARALAGLSMGGAESLLIGLNNRDKFSWVGSFSSGGLRENFDQEFPGLKDAANSQLHLVWVACGTDDGLLGINRDFNKWMTGEGITHIAVETSGNHTWMVWRRNLESFAPLLFR
jgi:enterochelin esterase family protein